MIQYTVRRLSKKTKGGRIIIALLGNESEALTPGTIDITTIVGNFGSVADLVTETAIESSRSAGLSKSEAGRISITAED
jgi:hypothetical protein